MKLSTLRTFAVMGAASLLSCFGASAADTGLYGRFDAGANFIRDTDVSVDGVPQGELEFDPGFRVDLSAGYILNHLLAVEVESGLLYNELDQFKGGGRFRDSWYGQVPVLGNLVFRYDNPSRFVPYLGAGAGVVFGMLDLGQRDTNFGRDESDMEILLAWQGQAGLNYKVADNVSVGVAYKYLGTERSNYKMAGSVIDAKPVHNHAFVLVLGMGF